ncbi:6-hydroxymethylpterin diphosphokinase MptE-like protein [Pararhodobacter marinus]|uniref:6-hydroxymethylpterin diphosphokinase MptE-like protein n=1 Tax=Pararhodobacter marinus TaxID=2184063 RepID=UPI003513A9B4
MSKIFVYPALTDPEKLENIVCRLAWYFKPYLSQIEKIHFTSTRAKLDAAGLAPKLDPLVETDLPAVKNKIQLLNHAAFEEAISALDPERDLLLIWDESAEKSAPAVIKAAIKSLTSKRGFYRVDPDRTRMEGSFYLWAGMNKYADQPGWIAQNHARMRKMVAEIGQHEKAYVFGSGPTLSDFVEGHDFSDGICVISNSIVKNRDIIARTKPRIIAAADPLYHAGCSSYAGAFRGELIDALRLTGAWFVCPLRDFAIYDAFLPADLRERIIGIPFEKESPVPVDLAGTFHLRPYPNVLTLALLPLASSVAKQIDVIGCDGRELTDDSFFWSHDAKAQFNDKMAEIQAAHPAFFAIDYNDYYIDHCRDVEQVLSLLESSGKTVVTRTPSMIPALRARQPEIVGSSGPTKAKVAAFAMIDPDAKDDWGHFLAYDKRVAEGCHDLDTDFVLLCRQELDPKFFPDTASLVIPTFSIHSWTVGNKWPSTNNANVMLFAKELDEAFALLEERYPVGEICVFMYIGSIEVAEAVEHLLVKRPRLRAVINLFWSYNFDQNVPDYKALWRRIVKRLETSTQVFLMHSTQQIADEFRKDWSVDLPVLPHPSTTFDDKAVVELAKLPRATPGKDLRVLFPGGTRKEKGFLLAAGACGLLADMPSLKPALRARIDHVSGRELETALQALVAQAGPKVEILDANLSDEEFIDMIRTADIVVIPYLSAAFRRRTSGILVDAFLLGKPVVVLKDTWLADIVEPGKIGLCADPDPASLAEAVREVAARYPEFLAGVAKVREDYLRKHSWKTLVSCVAEHAGFAKPTPRPILTKAQLEAQEKELKALVAKLPTRAPIYLPTEKISVADQIKGLTRVKKIYDTGLKDVYSPRLRALREKYRGTRRCFVIGNGPSLNETDLSLLKDEVTFAVNGFFLKTKDLDWKPTFYIVEDHLVAEDRAKWINSFKGPIKMFPAYLGYMFPETEDTIFYNHRPRKSYPHGFDFSTEADKITYTGATVTFSMLQLAFYMGFEEIYMIGVDASYAIPEDAQQASSYAVGVIDMKSDDVNHFHPDYFGKGFRWHDPQVDKMVEAYKEARKVVDQTNQRIYNATVGGQLEVFERRDFHSLFSKPETRKPEDYPRLLVLDMTPIGDGSATGEIKHNLMQDWPSDRVLQVSYRGPSDIALTRGRVQNAASLLVVQPAEADAVIDAFKPDVVLYRPVPNTRALHDFAMPLIERLGKPLATWIMDDWPQHLKNSDPEQYKVLHADFEALLKASTVRLSICNAMSEEMFRRYQLPFLSLANGVAPEDWETPKVHAPGTMVIRYAGGLEANMTRSSVLRIARVVEKLGEAGCDIRFEINTRAYYYQRNLKDFGGFNHTHFTAEALSPEAYKASLMNADVTLIAYNFDEKTGDYVKYSMANKMPECLASGAVLLAHGPKGFATIDYLNRVDGAVVVTENSDAAIEKVLRALQEDPARRSELAAKTRTQAFTRHNVFRLRDHLRELMARAASTHVPHVSEAPAEDAQSELSPAWHLLMLASRLLVQPAETLGRIEADTKVKALVERALKASETDAKLRMHYSKCLAYAQKSLKVQQ